VDRRLWIVEPLRASHLCSKFPVLLLLLVLSAPGTAQRNLAGAPQTKLALERLNVLGSVLMIAAHPDDENTALLAYFTRARQVRAGYLSLTRGEGGQNLIGPEQSELLGLIRTQELLAARRIDGAEQFFTRAIDFGFTKTAEETLAKWGHEKILSDVVWVIRRFRPDVIVVNFSGTSRDGHGQHQVSGMLAREAFTAAADPNRFPEQFKWVQPWQAKRILQGLYRGSAEGPQAQVEVDTGAYDPLLGYSYAEIAGMSRSMHRTQGFGAPERRGSQKNYLVHVAGQPAAKDVFDGIDTSWNRVPGGGEVGPILAEAVRSFEPEHPEKTIPLLLKARPLIAVLKDPWAIRKLGELDEALALCSGLWLDASADRSTAVPGSKLAIRATALNRSQAPLRLAEISIEPCPAGQCSASADLQLPYNQHEARELSWEVPEGYPYSQPFWLAGGKNGETYTIPDQTLIGVADSPPALRAHFRIRAGSESIELTRPIWHRYVDRVEGEQTRPLVIVPRVALRLSEPVLVFPRQEPKKIEVEVKANIAGAAGEVRLEVPNGWRIEPRTRKFQLPETGQEAALPFEITPLAGAASGQLRAVAASGNAEIVVGMSTIAYSHIAPQTVFPPSQARLVRADIRVLARKIGYVMGAGDEVPEALRQLGCQVTLLAEADLARGDFGGLDAIVTGVRAYNVRADLRANQQRLLEYVASGGTLVVQYNVADGALARIGPYPLQVSRDRVTVEEAPVTFPDPHSPLLKSPNQISAADFEGWIQERGLYFASQWDPQYKSLFESHDPDEAPHPGGTLFARYGQGAYVFTAYSWFRQLPAGVPGAYRIFANLLSAGKVLR